MARYNTDGSIDTTFSDDGKQITTIGLRGDYISGVALQSNGKILAVGSTDKVDGTSDIALARYNTDGNLDTSFGSDGVVTTSLGQFFRSYGNNISVQSDGKILVAGTCNGNLAVIRYNINGSLDTTFSEDGIVFTPIDQTIYISSRSIAVQNDGKILLAGTIIDSRDNSKFILIRYNTDGTLDETFHLISTIDGTERYTENNSSIILDGDVSIKDTELDAINNYSGSSITLSRHGCANAEDIFSSSGNFSTLIESNSVLYNSEINIGKVAQNSEGVLSVIFNSDATQSLVTLFLQSISYQNASDNPSSSVQIDWVFNDENTGTQGTGGSLTATGSTTINIKGINDAPVGTDSFKTVSLNTSHALNSADFVFSDAEDGTFFTAVRIDSLPSNGALYYKGVLVSTPGIIFTASDLNNGRVTYLTDTSGGNFSFSVKDSSGAYDSSPNKLTFHSNSAPTGNVTITGTVMQGQTLTAENTIGDVDGVGQITYSWKVNGVTVGSGNTLLLSQAEVGKTITTTASYTDDSGSTESVTSGPTTAVLNVNDLPTGSVTITGLATQGQTLTASNSIADADGMGAITYSWKANGTAVGSGTSFALTQSEVGKTITVLASYVDGGANTENVLSASNALVANINDVPTGAVTINGSAITGKLLTVSNSLIDADGLGEISYTWKSDGTTVGTGNTYVAAVADVGKAITVTAAYTDACLTPESITSDATALVTPIQLATASFTGTSADEWFVGTNANNTIIGGGGNDVFDGAAGTDSLSGGTGNDRYIVDLTAAGVLQDTITEAAGAGLDAIQLRGTSTNTTAATIVVGANLENMDSSLTGSSLLNLTGNALNNSLVGNDAVNVLTGAAGTDTMNGGQGSDRYVVALVSDYRTGEVIADTGTFGTDELRLTTTAASSLVLNSSLSGIENIIIGTGTSAVAVTTGTASINVNASLVTYGVAITGNAGANNLTGGISNDSLIGGSGNDTLIGNDGNDILDGGAGTDSLVGGSGNDTYVVDAATDVVNETVAGSNGTDTVQAAISYTLGTDLENLTLTGTSAINGVGNALDNVITGNSAANLLTGGGGADTLDGANGSDIYYMISASDYAGDVVSDTGESGIDELRFAATVASTLTLSSSVTGIESITIGTGTTATATTTGTAALNVDVSIFITNIRVTGNAGTNSINGGSGNDSLLGGAGNDTLFGGIGADSLVGGTGSDTFKFAAGNTGQTFGTDTISDYAKGAVGTGDLIDYSISLTIGGSGAVATSSEASISTGTGVATFAAASGTTLADALSDIAQRLNTAGDAAGEFSLFKVSTTGNYYLFISDGSAGLTENDVVTQLVGVTSISNIDLTNGDLAITA